MITVSIDCQMLSGHDPFHAPMSPAEHDLAWVDQVRWSGFLRQNADSGLLSPLPIIVGCSAKFSGGFL